MSTVNQKVFSADQHKQKMETYASELQTKRLSERKRKDTVNNFQQQIVNLERELEEHQGKGLSDNLFILIYYCSNYISHFLHTHYRG